MDGNDIPPPWAMALRDIRRHRCPRFLLPHLHARDTLSKAMGTTTVRYDYPSQIAQANESTASFESSLWSLSMPPSPSFHSSTTTTPSILKFFEIATKLSPLPPSSPFCVTMSRTTCTSRKTIFERSGRRLGFGLFLGFRNAGVEKMEFGGRQGVV